MRPTHLRTLLATACVWPMMAWAEPPVFTIDTFVKGEFIHTRPVTASELQAVAHGVPEHFANAAPGYLVLLDVARGMGPRERCFNLLTFRFTSASVEAGKVKATPMARATLKHAIDSLDEVNRDTGVTCTMRPLRKKG